MKTFNQFLAEMAGRPNNVPLIGSMDDTALANSNTLGGQMEKARAAKLAAQQQAAQAQGATAPAAPAGTDAVSPQAAAMAQKMAAAQKGRAVDAQLPSVFSSQKVGSIQPQAPGPKSPTQAQRLANMGEPVPATPEQLKAGQIDDDLPGGFGALVGSTPPAVAKAQAAAQPDQAPAVPPTAQRLAAMGEPVPPAPAAPTKFGKPPVPKLPPRKAGPPTRFDRATGEFVPVDQPPQG